MERKISDDIVIRMATNELRYNITYMKDYQELAIQALAEDNIEMYDEYINKIEKYSQIQIALVNKIKAMKGQ